MKINTFEDILAWQEARKLVNMIYKIKDNQIIVHDFRFKAQIQSASISVMSNIAEGFSRNSNKEFVRFLFISKGSLAELQSQLHIARDLSYISSSEFKEIYDQSDKTARLISKFITYLKSPNSTNSINTKNPADSTNARNTNNSINSKNSINPTNTKNSTNPKNSINTEGAIHESPRK